MRIYKWYLLLFLAFCLTQPACNNISTHEMPERFDWNPGASGAGFYPMEYSQIRFVYADGSVQWMPRTTVGQEGNAWGSNQATVMVGYATKPVPVKLNITWLSFTENQFYTGSFDLPHDKMLALFKKGWPDFDHGTNKPYTATYNNITVGMAPGGVVVVWLSGAAHRVDVASFKAHKTNVDMKDFAPASYTHNQTQYVNDIVKQPKQAAYLKEHGVPLGKWEDYRRHFMLRPVISFDKGAADEAQKIVLSYFNGEIETIEHSGVNKDGYALRAKVKTFYFWWKTANDDKSKGYELEINLDDDEVAHAYNEIFGKDGKGQAELFVEMNKARDNYLVVLQNQNKRVQLHKLQGNIYPVNN